MKVKMELYRLVEETCRQELCMQELDMVFWQKPGKTEDCTPVEKEPGKLEQQAGCMLVGKGDCKQVEKEDCKL